MVRANSRLSIPFTASLVVASIGAAIPRSNAAEYTLMPSPQTVHIGHFSAALKPILTIELGDTVTIETATQLDPADVDKSGAVSPSVVPDYTRTIFREVKDRGPGFHILTGPIFVNGAMPGDVLEVRIQQIDLAVGYGYNVHRPYLGALPDEFPGVFQRVIPIDLTAKTAQLAPGVVVPLTDPFFGTLGVAPWSGMGRISSGPPGVHTGNIDNKDVKAGTTLYMPIYAPGALFSVGDGHAAQGHGEVDLSAIETGGRSGAAHRYGDRCYGKSGCAEIVEDFARSVDATKFNPSFPAFFPRFIQAAIWRFCAQTHSNICNGNMIDDAERCRNRHCPAFAQCDRMCLKLG